MRLATHSFDPPFANVSVNSFIIRIFERPDYARHSTIHSKKSGDTITNQGLADLLWTVLLVKRDPVGSSNHDVLVTLFHRRDIQLSLILSLNQTTAEKGIEKAGVPSCHRAQKLA